VPPPLDVPVAAAVDAFVPVVGDVVPESNCGLVVVCCCDDDDARSTMARVDADAASPDEVVGREPGGSSVLVPASGLVSLQSSMTERRLD